MLQPVGYVLLKIVLSLTAGPAITNGMNRSSFSYVTAVLIVNCNVNVKLSALHEI